MNMRFKPYDPAWIADIAKQQRPDLPWLAESLARCNHCHEKRQGGRKKCIYAYFVEPQAANQPGSEWQFRESIPLQHPEFGHIKLDVLKDNRIGGIEFYDRLFSSGKPKASLGLDRPAIDE
jgi:hypothetical protein